MFSWKVLICVVFVLSVLELQPISGKKSFGGGHSYPKSGGLSGGGSRHSYPSSGGLSGGGSHGYPSGGGLSGGGRSPGSHPYPSSNNHGYPPSSSNHGYPSSSNNHGYPSSTNNHGYPSSSNNHGYPSSGGLSGNNNNKRPSGNTYNTHTVHNHYHYTPPQQIRYTPVGGGPAMSYPVYRGAPPTYVYQYKDSGSKYGTLLAGLALLNLGTLAAGTYALAHNNNNNNHGSSSSYKAQPGEVCKFAIKKENGDYEETRIDCQLISSFIYQEQARAQSPTNTNSTITTTTVTNMTVVNNTNVEPAPATVMPNLGGKPYILMPNGTLIPVNDTNASTISPIAPAPNNTMTSSVIVTTTTTNTTVVNALDVKGKPLDVTPGMQCFVIRLSPMGNMRKTVPCGLLQSYADQSLKKNAASRNVPIITILTVVFSMCLAY